jgi:uncharacterized protein YjiS (DUF1127 family)
MSFPLKTCFHRINAGNAWLHHVRNATQARAKEYLEVNAKGRATTASAGHADRLEAILDTSVMDARITIPTTQSAAIEAIRQEAMQDRDAKIGRWFRNLFRAVAEYPRRRRVMDELSMLTDRELADIGLSRGDIHRVFAMTEERPSATVHTLPVAAKGQVEISIRTHRIAA